MRPVCTCTRSTPCIVNRFMFNIRQHLIRNKQLFYLDRFIINYALNSPIYQLLSNYDTHFNHIHFSHFVEEVPSTIQHVHTYLVLYGAFYYELLNILQTNKYFINFLISTGDLQPFELEIPALRITRTRPLYFKKRSRRTCWNEEDRKKWRLKRFEHVVILDN